MTAVQLVTHEEWPEAVSDGLSLPCADCGDAPMFDYLVTDGFWNKWVPGEERRGVVCLPCLDRRCGGQGLAAALIDVHWTGTGHTVVLKPIRRYEYAASRQRPATPDVRFRQTLEEVHRYLLAHPGGSHTARGIIAAALAGAER